MKGPLSKEHQRTLNRIGDYFLGTGCEGWIEYWFWDVIHGKRPWLFWYEPDEGVRADMLALRDEAGVWLTWSFTRRIWEPVRLSIFEMNARRYGVVGAQTKCTDYQKKVGGDKNG